jgi:hypothetical protein
MRVKRAGLASLPERRGQSGTGRRVCQRAGLAVGQESLGQLGAPVQRGDGASSYAIGEQTR